MKTKIGMTFGLALMLAFGVVATMLAIGSFSTSPVQADHTTDATAGTVLGDVNVGGWSDGTTTSTIPTWTAVPNDPGAESKIEVKFTTYTQLDALTDQIIIEFPDDFDVPTVIDPSTVTIKASKITSPGTDVTGNQVNNPLDVTVELVGTPADESMITMTVPDMEPSTQSAALNHIDMGALVTVTFKQNSGIKNPTEAVDDSGAGWFVWASTSDAAASDQVKSTAHSIPRQVKLSATTGERGRSITVTGKGFENGTTATIWLDYDRDGVIDLTATSPALVEPILGSADVASDNTFSGTFTMAKPPFVTGSGVDTNDGTNYNAINAMDGEGNTIIPSSTYKAGTHLVKTQHATTDLPLLGYEGKMTVTPTTAAVGDTITVTLQEFDPSVAFASWSTRSLGGSTDNVTPSSSSAATDSNGDLTFDFVVPNGLPAGVHTLTIDTGAISGAEVKDITITGAVLTVTPDSVVPNQTVTLVGSGFSGSETINADSDASAISIGGSETDLKTAGSSTNSTKFNEDASVSTDNGGNWSASLIIPLNSTTVNPGTHELKVKDNGLRSGTTDLVLAERTLVLSTSESALGSTVTVTGAGYPAANTKAGADSTPMVSIQYVPSGSTALTVASLQPDASGNISGSFEVPITASIPSTNSVRSVFTVSSVDYTTATTHDIPKAVMTMDPISGPSGTNVTITGSGFKAHSTVSTLDFGSIDVRPAPVPATGTDGTFTTTVLIPQANTGAHPMKATVSSTTASGTFTVTDEPAVSGDTESATYFASIIDNGENLVRVFRFDNTSQSWSFFDPLPAFAEVNELKTVAGGDIVWVRVNEAQDFEGIALVAGWNLIVLP